MCSSSATALAASLSAYTDLYLKGVIEYHQGIKPKWSEAELRHLDTLTAEDVLVERHGISREFIRLYRSVSEGRDRVPPRDKAQVERGGIAPPRYSHGGGCARRAPRH